MADDYKNYTDYSSVIAQAISDFDSIQEKMKNKGVVDSSGNALNADTTGVTTSAYAGLIEDQLFRIGNRKKADLTAGISDNKIVDLGTISLSSGTVSFVDGTTAGERKLVVNATNTSAGYIDNAGKITITGLSAENFSVSGTLSDEGGTGYTYDEENKKYIIKRTDSVLESVEIKKGSGLIGATAGKNTHAGSKNEISLSTTTDNDNINSKVTLTAPADADAAKYVKIDTKAVAKCVDTFTAQLSKTFSSGYINAEDVAYDTSNADLGADGLFSHTFAEEQHAEGSQSIYLPKGNAEITSAEGSVGFSGADALIADAGDDLAAADTFATVTASVSGLKISGNITEGWVGSSGISADDLTLDSKSIKIKKGSLTAGSTNVHIAKELSNVEEVASSSYKISLSKDGTATDADASNVALTVTNGYLTSTDVANAKHTVTVENSDIYLKAAQVKKKIDNASVALDGTGAGLLSSTTPTDLSKYYSVSTKVSASIVDDGSVNGYFNPAIDTTAFSSTGLTAEETNTFYLKKGSVDFKHAITISDGATASGLTEAKPSGTLGKDYFEISTNGTLTTAEGYITKDDVTEDDDKKYYIPKAVVKYVQNSDDSSFLEIKTAGYLPSGTIAVDEGTLDEAVVKGTLTSDVISTAAAVPSGAYAINIAKSIADGDAGYISANKGSLSLDATYYIAHGSLTYTAGIASIEKNSITKNGSVFNVSVTAKGDATATPTLVEGYVKNADLTINAPEDKTVDIAIDEATIGLSGDGSITASSDTVESVATSKYVITPSFTGGTMSGNVTKEGYVDSTTAISGNVTIKDTTNFYVKAGTTKTLTPTAHAKALAASEITDNFSSTASGDYTITINGKDSLEGSLAVGYYGADEATISANSTIAGTYSVKHGSASITAASAKFALTASGITLVSAPSDAEKYYKLTANASNLSLSKSVTAGYIKDADLDASLATITGSEDKYIAAYKWGEDKLSATQAVTEASVTIDGAATEVYRPASVTDFGENADYAVIHTKETYAEKDIYVNLGDDAIGANAKADLEKLKQRLAGTLVKA